MRSTASAISLNVNDVKASATFVKQHLGFSKEMSADGFVSLSRQDAGFTLVFLQTGLKSFKPAPMRDRLSHSTGLGPLPGLVRHMPS